MKKKALSILLLTAVVMSTMGFAEEVFRIEIGKDYQKYSQTDLQRRVWELERAVAQLQQRVFHLEGKPQNYPASVDTWICTIKAMGTIHTGTGASMPVAKAKVIEACKSARGDSFFCKDPSCEQ